MKRQIVLGLLRNGLTNLMVQASNPPDEDLDSVNYNVIVSIEVVDRGADNGKIGIAPCTYIDGPLYGFRTHNYRINGYDGYGNLQEMFKAAVILKEGKS